MSVGNASSVTAYSATKELQATEIDYWQAASATPPAGAPDQTGETELLKANFITSGGTTPLLTEYTQRESIYAVVVRSRRNLSPRLRVFIDFVEQKLRGKSWNVSD